MQPLDSSYAHPFIDTEGVGTHQGGAASSSSTETPEVPNLDLEQVRERSSEGETVLPYFTPRGTYETPRTELTEAGLLKQIEESRGELILRSYHITPAAALKLREILERADCSISALEFVNCGLPAELMETVFAGLARNLSVKALHFEGCVLGRVFCSLLKDLLIHGRNQLCTLNFANVSIPVEAFRELSIGVANQNPLSTGIATLCFEGCRLNDHYADLISSLIAGNIRLKTLVLQGNQLGSGALKGGASRAIQAIANAVRGNDCLHTVILASNQINFADYRELLAATQDSNPQVRFNLTGNALDVPTSDRLITQGSSPRSIAFQLAADVAHPSTARKSDTPRKVALQNSSAKH